MLTIFQTLVISFLLWASFTYAWGAHIFLWNGAQALGAKTGLTARLAWFVLSPFSVGGYMLLIIVTKGTVSPVPAPESDR